MPSSRGLSMRRPPGRILVAASGCVLRSGCTPPRHLRRRWRYLVSPGRRRCIGDRPWKRRVLKGDLRWRLLQLRRGYRSGMETPVVRLARHLHAISQSPPCGIRISGWGHTFLRQTCVLPASGPAQSLSHFTQECSRAGSAFHPAGLTRSRDRLVAFPAPATTVVFSSSAEDAFRASQEVAPCASLASGDSEST